MRFILISYLLISNVFAQISSPSCKSVFDIALMERQGHDRLSAPSRDNSASATTNYDIRYYRLEWEIDPAIKYIKGNLIEVSGSSREHHKMCKKILALLESLLTILNYEV